MKKFKILEKVFVEGHAKSVWEGVETPSDFMAEGVSDAIIKFLVFYGGFLRQFNNISFHWCGDLCEVYFTDCGRKVEIHFTAKEIVE